MDSYDLIVTHHSESKNIFLDLIAGSIAGIAITITGHPFDLHGFYKGLGFPISTMPIVNAVIFATNEKTKRVFNLHDEEQMSYGEGTFCGSVAGFVNCIVITPVELVKCRLQMQFERETKNSYYKGIFDCILKTFRNEGIKGLYRGNFASILREIPAYAGQFGGYHFAKTEIAQFKGKTMDSLKMYELMICGAIGGYFCWQLSYPQDVIKTLLQTETHHKFKTHSWIPDGGFFNCTEYIYRNQGLMGFWRGYLPCTIRALYANAFLFAVYEKSKAFLEKFKPAKK